MTMGVNSSFIPEVTKEINLFVNTVYQAAKSGFITCHVTGDPASIEYYEDDNDSLTVLTEYSYGKGANLSRFVSKGKFFKVCVSYGNPLGEIVFREVGF